MSDTGFFRKLFSSLAARSRRRMIRKLLAKSDIRELTWMPPSDSPLSYRDSPVRLAMDYVIGPRTLAFGHWHDEHCELIRRELKAGRRYHLVDVGANAGLVSRQLLASPGLTFEGADCFEPEPASFTLLQSNMSPFPTARLHAAALSDTDGEAHIFRGSRNAGDISLTPSAQLLARQDLQTHTVRLLEAGREAGAILGSLASDATRLVWKSDTQGHDLKIVAALPAAFWQRVDVALIEVTSVAATDDEIERFVQVLAGFPIRRSLKFGGKDMSAAQVGDFVRKANGSEMDLLLARGI